MRIVKALQISCALAARKTFQGGPDLFGEEQTLILLRSYLFEKGLIEPEALLQTADPSIPIAASFLLRRPEREVASIPAEVPALSTRADNDINDDDTDTTTKGCDHTTTNYNTNNNKHGADPNDHHINNKPQQQQQQRHPQQRCN